MKAEKYLVTSYFQNRRRTQIWDSAKPMPLDHKFKWILENVAYEPQLRSLSGAPKASGTDSVISISQAIIENETLVKLPDEIDVQFKRLKPIPPPYLAPKNQNATTTQRLLAFYGSGRGLIGYETIHSAYVGYVRKTPVFTLRSSADGYQIEPLIPDVHLKLDHQKSVQAQPGEIWKLNFQDLAGCTLVRGSRWWRFNSVGVVEDHVDKQTQPSWGGESSQLFRNALIFMLTLFVIGSGVLSLHHSDPQPEKEVKPEAPIVKFVTHKNKSTQVPLTIVVEPQKPAAPILVQAPRAKPAEKPRAASPTLQKTPQSGPTGSHIQKIPTAVSKLAALRSALGGAISLIKNSAGTLAKDPHPSGGMFNSATSLSPTEIKPGYSTANLKVEKFGGGSKGTGYGGSQGISNNLAKKGSFVVADDHGIEVEKGLLLEEVGAVIHSHMAEIRYCHESAMLSNPNISGKIVIQFSIDQNGTIEKSKIESSNLGDPSLESCIMKKLVNWRFPKPKGGIHVAVSYPFIFKTLERN